MEQSDFTSEPAERALWLDMLEMALWCGIVALVTLAIFWIDWPIERLP